MEDVALGESNLLACDLRKICLTYVPVKVLVCQRNRVTRDIDSVQNKIVYASREHRMQK